MSLIDPVVPGESKCFWGLCCPLWVMGLFFIVLMPPKKVTLVGPECLTIGIGHSFFQMVGTGGVRVEDGVTGAEHVT